MSEHRIPILPTIVVVAAVATMIMLGFWQLGRLDEKAAMMARFAQASETAAPLAAMPEDPLANIYRKTAFTCSSVTGWSAISGRNDRDLAGYVHVASCPQGAVVLGWSTDPSLTPDWQGGTITGTIAPSGKAGWRLVAAPPLAGLQANAAPDPADTPNNHLAYAVQWFLFALTALVIYILALRRRAR